MVDITDQCHCNYWFTNIGLLSHQWREIEMKFRAEEAVSANHLYTQDMKIFFKQNIEQQNYVGPPHCCKTVFCLMFMYRKYPGPKLLEINRSPIRLVHKDELLNPYHPGRAYEDWGSSTRYNPDECVKVDDIPIAPIETVGRIGLVDLDNAYMPSGSLMPPVLAIPSTSHASLASPGMPEMPAISAISAISTMPAEASGSEDESTIIPSTAERVSRKCSKTDLGAGLLKPHHYKVIERSNRYYNLNIDEIGNIEIDSICQIFTKKIRQNGSEFSTIVVKLVLKEANPTQKQYQWFYVWKFKNGEEKLKAYFRSLSRQTIVGLKNGNCRSFVEAALEGRRSFENKS